MHILESISNISVGGIIILILVICVFIFLIFLTVSLLKKNKELSIQLTKINNDKEIPVNNNDLSNTSIEKENITEDKEEIIDPIDQIDTLINDKEQEVKDNKPPSYETNNIALGAYQRNVLDRLGPRGQTSPVNIGKSAVDVPKVKVTSYVKEHNNADNKSYLEQVSKKLAEEIEPQTIELTEYEKKQEEEAIISYQELIKNKDRLYKIDDDEEIDSFIDELKNFRIDLE